MPQSWWNFLRGRIWMLTGGLFLAAVAASLAGTRAAWGLVGLGLLLGTVQRFLAKPVEALRIDAPAGRDGGSMVSALTRQLLEQLPMPALLLDEAERVQFVNQPMRMLLGGGALKSHVSAVIRNPAVLEAIDHTVKTGEPANVPFSLPVPIERHFQAYAASLHVTPRVTALLLHDLTAIRRSEQMRADFVANASHELRTPLAAVSGFIDTLRGHAKDDPAAQEQFLGIMSVEAARMRRLIDDLLSLTRIELNEHVPPQGRIQLLNVVREAVAALRPLAEADRITLSITGGENLPEIVGDRDELVQLFQNLVHNAIKYGREGGHVWVRLGSEGGQVFAAVRDDGEGIPQSAIPRLTERFYRVDVKRSREKGGTGLGLAIVKHIVSRHQGRLAIESPPGEGAVFTVFLPMAAPESADKSTAPRAVTEVL